MFRFLLPFALLASSCLTLSAQEKPGSSPVLPVPQRGMEKRHADKAAAAKARGYDLLLIGDSITQNLERPEFREVWNRFFAPRNALNLGYSGGRTENTLWNLANGELEGQHPKVVTLLIGTNNADDANYPVAHSPEQILEGTRAIVQLLRERLPNTKILLLRTFPRTNVYRKPDGSERGSAASRYETTLKSGELTASLADGKNVFFLDLNHLFVNPDGTPNRERMPDQLHPSPAGALVWAQAMEPTLAKLFGDEPKSPPSANNAVVPVSKLENDSYDWWKRHEAVLAEKSRIKPEIVLIGDSITHFWGGNPSSPGAKARGPKAFAETFGTTPVLNLGYGWDRTQNVLWRLDNSEFDGLQPKWVVINIGTNNFAKTSNARDNTPQEIAEGVRQIILRVRSKSPKSSIILMGVFPRGEKPTDPMRAKITELNQQLASLAQEAKASFVDLTPKLTQPDGTISREVMNDFLHPTEIGYAIWGSALKEAMKGN